MTKRFFFFALFYVALYTVSLSAQSNNQAYWNAQADKAIQKADRYINHYNKQTKTFTPAELRMMRTSPQRFTQMANARSQRYSNATRQYQQMYNQDWVNSFGAMGPRRVIVRQPVVVRRPAPRRY